MNQEKSLSARKEKDQAYILRKKLQNIKAQKITLRSTAVKENSHPRWNHDDWDNWHPDF